MEDNPFHKSVGDLSRKCRPWRDLKISNANTVNPAAARFNQCSLCKSMTGPQNQLVGIQAIVFGDHALHPCNIRAPFPILNFDAHYHFVSTNRGLRHDVNFARLAGFLVGKESRFFHCPPWQLTVNFNDQSL